MHSTTPRTALPRALLLTTFLGLLGGLPAVAGAQDDPSPAPVKDAETAPAEDGRKVSEAALAMLEGWGKKMHLPQRTSAKALTAHAKAGNPSLFQGGDLEVDVSWKRDGGLALDVELPKEMRDSMPPEAIAMAKSVFGKWSREALAPVFESPEQYSGDYNVGERKEGERTVVELLPFSDDAAAELQLLYFDDEGLCERRIMIPRVDMDDPNQQMMVGVEVESTFGYERVGDRYVLKRMSMLLPFGELLAEYEYYDVTDGIPLLREVKMVTPFSPEPIDVKLSDYTVDGSTVEATEEKNDADEETPESGDGDE